MRTFLRFLVAVLALPTVLCAQNFTSQSLLNVKSLATGTNLFGITNLSAVVTNAGMVHATNLVYTNLAGTRLQSPGAAGGTNNLTTVALFRDVSLYTDRNGTPPYITGPFASATVDNQTNYMFGHLNLYVEIGGIAGSNAPIGINLCPVWDGDRTPTSTSDDFSLRIAGGVGYRTIATNLPTWRWAGAQGLRVRNITNEYIIGGDAGLTNAVFIHKLSVNGFRP